MPPSSADHECRPTRASHVSAGASVASSGSSFEAMSFSREASSGRRPSIRTVLPAVPAGRSSGAAARHRPCQDEMADPSTTTSPCAGHVTASSARSRGPMPRTVHSPLQRRRAAPPVPERGSERCLRGRIGGHCTAGAAGAARRCCGRSSRLLHGRRRACARRTRLLDQDQPRGGRRRHARRVRQGCHVPRAHRRGPAIVHPVRGPMKRHLRSFPLSGVYALLEPGPVVLVTTARARGGRT